jgi:uncharacterized protein (TIGR02145 family)
MQVETLNFAFIPLARLSCRTISFAYFASQCIPMNNIIPFVSLLLFFLSGAIKGQESIKIGNQTWMTKNLNVVRFANGEPIPEARTDEEWKKAGENHQPAWCFQENKSGNGRKFGRLYNWYAVTDARHLCPTGWHVPSDEEWNTLEEQLGGGRNGIDTSHGNKLKSSSGWKKVFEACGNCINWASRKAICPKCKNSGFSDREIQLGTNSTGFTALPGGYRNAYGQFSGTGFFGSWWSTSDFRTSTITTAQDPYFDNFARGRCLLWFRGWIVDYIQSDSDFHKAEGSSVRCLRD